MTETKASRLPIWLVVSLIVNALLIGLIIGGGLGKRRDGPPPHPGGSEMEIARGMESVVEGEDRAAMRQALRAAFERSRGERRELRQARRDLSQLLGAEPYDREAVLAGFARLRTADSNMKAGLHDELAIQLEKLSAEQRRAMLRFVENSARHPRRPDQRRPMRRQRRDRPPPPQD